VIQILDREFQVHGVEGVAQAGGDPDKHAGQPRDRVPTHLAQK
jgi:hypothetical protein